MDVVNIPFSIVILAALVVGGAGGVIYLMRHPAYRRFVEPLWLPTGMITVAFGVFLVCAYVNPDKRLWLWISSGVLALLVFFWFRRWRVFRREPTHLPLPSIHRALLCLVAFAYFGPFALVAGGVVGGDLADAMRARLELVWPDLMSMPVDDRAVVVRLGIRCGVNNVALEKAAVVTCLRSADGSGEDVARLDHLLKSTRV